MLQELVTHTQKWDWAVVSCQTRIFTRFFNGYHLGLSPNLRDGMCSHDSGEKFGQLGASFGAQVLQEFHMDVVVTWGCRWFFHWDMAIYRFSKWRPSAILELFYHYTSYPRSLCCWPQLPVKFYVNLIHRSEDIAIWFFLRIWLEMPILAPKMGVLGDFGPVNVIIHHWDSQKAHPCVNLRLLSYQL